MSHASVRPKTDGTSSNTTGTLSFVSLSPYKVVNCKFFDKAGLPIFPFCAQGARCHFLHPSDPSWPGGQPRAFSSNTSYSKPKINLDTDMRSSRQSLPLASQASLFARSGPESRDNDELPSPRKSPSSSSSRRERDRSSSVSSRRYETRSYLGVERPEEREKYVRQRPASTRWDSKTKDRQPSDAGNEDEDVFKARKDILPSFGSLESIATIIDGEELAERVKIRDLIHKNLADGENPFVGRIVGLFQNLAKLTNKLSHDTAAAETEEKQMQKYAALSDTLGKISADAASAVAPTMSALCERYNGAQERVEHDSEAISTLWGEIFELFSSGIASAIDLSMEETLGSVKREGERIMQAAVIQSVATFQAQIMDIQRNPKRSRSEVDEDEGENEGDRRKKRRMKSSSPDSTGDQTLGEINPVTSSKVQTPMQLSLHGILEEMKTKIEEQATTLETLAHENIQLKASLEKQPSIIPSGPRIRPGALSSTPGWPLSPTQRVDHYAMRPVVEDHHASGQTDAIPNA